MNGSTATCDTLEETIDHGEMYGLEVVVEGDSATLAVDGEEKVSCDFGPGGIHDRWIGLRIANAHMKKGMEPRLHPLCLSLGAC